MNLSASPGGAQPEENMRVLVADDSESTRYVLATWLRKAGYHVLEARTGEEALAMAVAHPIDLAVLDVNFPDMSGYVVCENIKAQRETAVPVLHVSATAIRPADRSEGLRRGADGYLVEPVEREELLASVAALLRGAAAERTAVRLSLQLRRLNDATLALSDSVTLQQLVATIAREASTLFEAAVIAAVIVDETGLTATCEPSGEPEVVHGPAQAVNALRRAAGDQLLIPAASLHGLVSPPASKAYLRGELSDPRGHRGILLVSASDKIEHRAMADETTLVLSQFARAARIAIKNMRAHDVERGIALTLQRSLLPDVVPAIPGVEVAVRYQASDEHNEVGGDFYEVFALDEDHVALAVGDVVGHSLAAATVMAELRTGIRSYLLEGHGPTATIERINRLLQRFHPGLIATVCCAIYDLRDGRCELANAGHPPPLLVGREGTAFLPIGGALLGVDAKAVAPHVFTLHHGDVLLMFTDGLVERRDESIDDGLNRLARAAAHATGNLDELCDRLLREAGPANVSDDIALVALRRHDG